jgi:hypothetical protein
MNSLTEKLLEERKRLEKEIASKLEYSQGLKFQRVIGNYQILMGILVALFAFGLGKLDFYIMSTSGILVVICYFLYTRKLNRIQKEITIIWANDTESLEKLTLKLAKENKRKR